MSKVPRGYTLIQNLRKIQAHGGEYFIENCQPWQIPKECERLDCPMRTLAIPPEQTEEAAVLQCDPVGQLADTLIVLQKSN